MQREKSVLLHWLSLLFRQKIGDRGFKGVGEGYKLDIRNEAFAAFDALHSVFVHVHTVKL